VQRYFVSQPATNQLFSIDDEDRHHIVHVMRMQPGDELICVGPDGQSAICQIAEITDELVVAKVVQWNEDVSELPISVTIASGLPKGDKLEWIIQKGTELGAAEFLPFSAARSVVKWDEKKAVKKIDRWQKIAKEAAEQSHRTVLPKVLNPLSFKELLQQGKQYDYRLAAFEDESRSGETAVFSKTLAEMKKGDSLLIVFGPEGGLSAEEVHALKANDFTLCGLGPRILRTETAPLYTLSAISYHFELLR
jgi:16S rRNA (uracil1498-N3)-methyltransferase